MVQNLPAMQETQVQALDWEDPLEKEMATHSSIVESRKCMFIGSLSRHNKDLERQTLKPYASQLSGLGQTVLQLLGKSVLQLYFI